MRSPARPQSAGSSVERGSQHHEHCEPGAQPEHRDVGDAGEREPGGRQADDDAREEHRRAGRRHGARRGLAPVRRADELLAVARGQEQAVVDPDAEADHRREIRGGGTHREEVRQEVQCEDPGGEPGERVDER